MRIRAMWRATARRAGGAARLNFMEIEAIHTPDECHVLPSFIVCRGRCEDPECDKTHGYQVIVQWLWWGFMLTFLFDEE